MELALKVLLVLVVFLIPLIGASSNFGYEQIKILYFLVSITLIGIFWTPIKSGWIGISKAAGLIDKEE